MYLFFPSSHQECLPPSLLFAELVGNEVSVQVIPDGDGSDLQ